MAIFFSFDIQTINSKIDFADDTSLLRYHCE